MSEPLDNLVIDIQYKSSTASSGVDKLTTSLTSLRSATKGGVGLTAVSKQITNLNTSLSAVKGLDKISGLVTGLNGLQGVGKASGFTSTINSLKKLPTVIDELDKADLGKFNTQVETLVTIMRPLGTEMQKVSNGFSVLPKNIQKAINANAKLTTSNKKINTSYTTLRNNLSLTVAKFIAVVYAIRRVARAIGEWIDQSNQYQENLNLFRVSMGEYYDASLKYAKQVENTLGIDSAQWIRYQAVFQNMTEGFGVASDKAEIMSRNLTQMGYDLASVFNVEVDTAMEKLESALSGQPRPMREWGFDLSEASLKAVALSHGIDKNVEKMSQMEKAQLRYIYLYENMERLGLSGDFARTLEAPANALRVLNSQVGMAKRELGNMFIPMLNKMLPVVTAIVKVIRWVASEIASLLGFTMTDIDYSSLTEAIVMPETDELATDDIADSLEGVKDNANDATDAVKELKKGLLGFDEINMLPDQSDKGVGGVADDLKDALDDIDNSDLGGFDLTLPDNADWLDGALKSRSDAIFEQYKAKIQPAIQWIKDNIDTIKDAVIIISGIIAAWKIGKGFAAAMAAIKGLSTMGAITLGVTLAVAGIVLEATGIKSAIEDKLNGLNFTEIVSGALLTVGGAALFGGKIAAWFVSAFPTSTIATFLTTTVAKLGTGTVAGLGAALAGGVAAIIAGLPAYLVGIWDAVKNGINWLNGLLITFGATAVGAGVGAIIGSLGGPIGTGIGALIGLAVGALTDLIIVIVEKWENVKSVLSSAKDWFDTKVVAPIRNIKDEIVAIYEPITSIASGIIDRIAIVFDKFVEIGSKIKEIIVAVGGFVWDKLKEKIFTPIADKFNVLIEEFKIFVEKIKQFFAPLVTFVNDFVIKPIMGFFTGFYDKVVNLFKNIAVTVSNALSSIIKSALNGVFSIVEGLINGFINALNWSIDVINNIPGVSISKVETIEIPRFAEGGHPAPGQLFVANEAGAEMVGNLNGRSTVANNQDIAAGIDEATYRGMMRAWNEQRAAGGGRQTVVPVQINGRTLFEVVVEENNSAVKATGATPLLV